MAVITPDKIEARVRDIRMKFRELIPKATLTCPVREHVHDHGCYHSYSLSYWSGQYDALRELQWEGSWQGSIQDALDALATILNVHENHLFPDDTQVFEAAVKRLNIMKNEGFK